MVQSGIKKQVRKREEIERALRHFEDMREAAPAADKITAQSALKCLVDVLTWVLGEASSFEDEIAAYDRIAGRGQEWRM